MGLPIALAGNGDWVQLTQFLNEKDDQSLEPIKKELLKDKDLLKKILFALSQSEESKTQGRESALTIIQKLGNHFESMALRLGLLAVLENQPDDWALIVTLNAYLSKKEHSSKNASVFNKATLIYKKNIMNPSLESASVLAYLDGLEALKVNINSIDLRKLFFSKNNLIRLDVVKFSGNAWLRNNLNDSVMLETLQLAPMALKLEVLRAFEKAPKSRLTPFLGEISKLESTTRNPEIKLLIGNLLSKKN